MEAIVMKNITNPPSGSCGKLMHLIESKIKYKNKEDDKKYIEDYQKNYFSSLGILDEDKEKDALKKENIVKQAKQVYQELSDFLADAPLVAQEKSKDFLEQEKPKGLDFILAFKENRLRRFAKDQVDGIFQKNTRVGSEEISRDDKNKLIENYQAILFNKDKNLNKVSILNKKIKNLEKQIEVLEEQLEVLGDEKEKLLRDEKNARYDYRMLLQKLKKKVTQEVYKELDGLIESEENDKLSK